jgi:hypothetical protein
MADEFASRTGEAPPTTPAGERAEQLRSPYGARDGHARPDFASALAAFDRQTDEGVAPRELTGADARP